MEVKTVGVYGAGFMGRGIAQVALEGGYDVVLYNHRTPTLEKGVAGIQKNFAKKVAKGKITQEQADELIALAKQHGLESIGDEDRLTALELAVAELGVAMMTMGGANNG